jgi:gliding motility-associated-like protein
VNAIILTSGCNAITITTQPADFLACPGGVATFTVVASGTTNIKYQWQFSIDGVVSFADITNNTNYSNATTATLSVNTTGNFGAGRYRCKIDGDLATTIFTNDEGLFINNTNCNAPVISTEPLATQIGGKVTLDLKPLIATADLDLTSLQITSTPSSGANATIDANGILTIDYLGKSFAGTEQITIKACDKNGLCTTQNFSVEVVGDIIVYNGVSPNGVNPKLVIQYIEILPDTKNNTVYIFDRWQNLVWTGNNYDNNSVVFTGQSDGGGELPSGVYFYKIDFASGRKTKTGFVSLRR